MCCVVAETCNNELISETKLFSLFFACDIEKATSPLSTQSLPPHTHSLASVAGEALRVVRLSKRCHHPPLHILSTREALGPKQDVVVFAAVVVVILHEVASGGQQLPAFCVCVCVGGGTDVRVVNEDVCVCVWRRGAHAGIICHLGKLIT